MLGRGGEGAVFHCAHDAGLVAKIYNRSINEDKAAKLRWMAQMQNKYLLNISAWVLDTLHDTQTGRTTGFLMPAINAKEIHELYSTKSRKVHFPKADWPFLIRVAINLAKAFYTVHDHGLVIGDVNQGNFAVTEAGTVKLIDCDSFHVKANGRVFPCEVGVTTHIPPEFQGRSLTGMDRLPKHDNFGLAVIIFQLLFLGRHPFSGNYIGKGADKSLEDSIKEMRFAYGPGAASRQVKQPPHSLSLEAVSEPIANLFERAFLTLDNRPTPKEWVDGLEGLSKHLTQCKRQKSHAHLNTLSKCPWCEIEGRAGILLFPTPYATSTGGGIDILTIENLLSSIRIPAPLPNAPTKLAVLPPASPEIQSLKKRSVKRLAIISSVQLALIIGLVALAGVGGGCGGGLLVFLVAFAVLNNSDRGLKENIRVELESATQQWEAFESEWRQRTAPTKLAADAADIRKKIASYKTLPEARLRKLQQLNDQVYERQLADYLDKFRIDQANISGIGWSRTTDLMSYGIETAADVQANRIMAINGFGPTYTQKLLSWRANLERRFRFDPAKGVSQQDKHRVEQEIANTRAQLEAAIQSSVSQLKFAADNVAKNSEYLTSKLASQAQILAQAESNAHSVSTAGPVLAILLSIWLGIPLLGAGVMGLLNTPTNQTQLEPAITQPESRNAASSTSVNMDATNTALASTATSAYNVPYLSDTEIAMLPSREREAKAEELFNQGVVLTRALDPDGAEAKYREAIRYNPEDARFHHELGYSLYRQGKFSESIPALQKSLELNPNSENSEKVMGTIHVAMANWREAKVLYLELRERYPKSFQYQYNLGLAAKATGDRLLALEAFEKAVEIRPKEPHARYELGMQYVKDRDFDSAETQYDALVKMRPALAQKLRTEIDKWR